MSVNFGSKRVVTGAHYGLRDWMAQRATAVLMALFTVLLLAQVLTERWRKHYNTVRPHSSLGYCPPEPETIIPADQLNQTLS